MGKHKWLAVCAVSLMLLASIAIYTSYRHPVTLNVYFMQTLSSGPTHQQSLSGPHVDQTNVLVKLLKGEALLGVGTHGDYKPEERELQKIEEPPQELQRIEEPSQSSIRDFARASEENNDASRQEVRAADGEESLCYTPTAESSHVNFVPCVMESLGPRLLPVKESILESPQAMPFLIKLWPEISNGHVASVVQTDSIYMNGLYNGANRSSHRARIPSTANIRVNVTGQTELTALFRLDVGRAVFSELLTGDGFTVEVRRYAHRELTRLLVTEVVVKRTTSTLPITVSLDVKPGRASKDIKFSQEKPGLWTGETIQAEYPEIAGTTPVAVAFSVVPKTLTFPPVKKPIFVSFFTSVSTNESDALNFFDEGVRQFLDGKLFSSHVNQWEGLWKRGRIEMSGNDTMALNTNAAFYYLLGALPLKDDVSWPFIGMSPGGLGHGGGEMDYDGHVFWDQDIWMFPSISLLHADLGRIIAGTRLRTHNTARLYAHETGYDGARFPWESGFTGLDVTPSKACAHFEVHVTADASWMMRQYLQMTNDTEFFEKHGGYELLADIADYWVSRSTYNPTSMKYEILGVMGPDEYHYTVNNSVYTNIAAVQSMRTAQLVGKMINKTSKPMWEKVASKMEIEFDEQLQYHPEFTHYKRGSQVKQADVILIGFPFRWPMLDSVRYNDLDYYSKVTPGGPAMTWGAFAINWLRLGQKEKADKDFFRGTWNIQEPFKVWSENADGSGAYNFQTGMGGYMQSLVFGYVGVNLNDDSMVINPELPPSLTSMALRGMDYMGSSLDLEYDFTEMQITVIKEEVAFTLQIKNVTLYLREGKTVRVSRQMAILKPIST